MTNHSLYGSQLVWSTACAAYGCPLRGSSKLALIAQIVLCPWIWVWVTVFWIQFPGSTIDSWVVQLTCGGGYSISQWEWGGLLVLEIVKNCLWLRVCLSDLSQDESQHDTNEYISKCWEPLPYLWLCSISLYPWVFPKLSFFFLFEAPLGYSSTFLLCCWMISIMVLFFNISLKCQYFYILPGLCLLVASVFTCLSIPLTSPCSHKPDVCFRFVEAQGRAGCL